ncbi:MAG: SPFH domain-containing protein [Coriobacteriia bacterium]|nr:SPFH domain-containing protein [Coriobacteriia bacterium]MCL2751034.1 SPFH domain-containing protein [Coriobacteriia bacterium]
MGLIRAATGAFSSQLADQWRDYFYAESLPIDILAVKGQKRIDPGRSSNINASENIISNGSILAIADGQCAMIVEQGKVVELCVETGEFIWDTSTEPSVFREGLGRGISESIKVLGRRISFGGDTAKDQRIYYFNIKEIVDNRFGSTAPIPFRMIDSNIGLDMDLAVRCNGTYSFKINNPVLFYANVTGNIEAPYHRSQLQPQLKTELLSALQPAFAQVSAQGIRYSQIPAHTSEIAGVLKEILSESWMELRGIELVSIGFNSISLPPEDENRIKSVQLNAVMRDTNMAAATLVGAQSEAMKAAGANEGGAMLGFMGLGMAQAAGGNNAAQLFQMEQGTTASSPAPSPATPNGWSCACGQAGNLGKFCQECGSPAPTALQEWRCACGIVNRGKFCQECGNSRQE